MLFTAHQWRHKLWLQRWTAVRWPKHQLLMSCPLQDCSFFWVMFTLGKSVNHVISNGLFFPPISFSVDATGLGCPKFEGSFQVKILAPMKPNRWPQEWPWSRGWTNQVNQLLPFVCHFYCWNLGLMFKGFFHRNKGFNNFTCHIRLVIMHNIHLDFWSFVNIWWYRHIVNSNHWLRNILFFYFEYENDYLWLKICFSDKTTVNPFFRWWKWNEQAFDSANTPHRNRSFCLTHHPSHLSSLDRSIPCWFGIAVIAPFRLKHA